MAACPWCKTYSGGIGGYDSHYCLSPENPGNHKKGDETQSGVARGRCAWGQEVNGMGFKDCPFFKKKTTKKRS